MPVRERSRERAKSSEARNIARRVQIRARDTNKEIETIINKINSKGFLPGPQPAKKTPPRKKEAQPAPALRTISMNKLRRKIRMRARVEKLNPNKDHEEVSLLRDEIKHLLRSESKPARAASSGKGGRILR